MNILPSLIGESRSKRKKKKKNGRIISIAKTWKIYIYIFINYKPLFVESSIYSESGGNKFLFSTISQFFFSSFNDRRARRGFFSRSRWPNSRTDRADSACKWMAAVYRFIGEGGKEKWPLSVFTRASTNRFWKVGNFKWAAFIGTPVLC